MVKIDLITGFLGSGKTTFIKKYAKYLIDQGLNIGILAVSYTHLDVYKRQESGIYDGANV